MNLTLRVAYKCSLSMILHNKMVLKWMNVERKKMVYVLLAQVSPPTCMIYMEDGKLYTCIVLFS